VPLFHQYKLAFVHIPKCGGQTVERVFGPDDSCDLFGVDGDVELSNLTAHEIRERVVGRGIDDYLTFAFVRNPWDRLVSEYFYRLKCGSFPYLDYPLSPPSDFDMFVQLVTAVDLRTRTHVAANHLYPQTDFICDRTDRFQVDFVGRFESFERDLRVIASARGVRLGDVPRINATSHGPYRDYYTAATAEAVGKLYARDREVLGYAF
jgi:hypothetical protein